MHRRTTEEIIAVGGYRPEIDGLRMIAVLAVICYHAALPFAAGGYVGVDVFFVISGYLITKIIARQIAAGQFRFVDFYERRARRILPALFLVCAFVSAAGSYLLSPEQFKDLGQSLVATMGFAANIYFYLKIDYFAPAIHLLPLIHMWSLAVEEQFYLAFPFILLVVLRLGGRWRRMALSAAFASSLFLSVYHQASSPEANFYLTPFRAWELLAGGLLALDEAAISGWFQRRPLVSQLAAWVGLAGIVVPITLYTDATVFPGAWALPVVFGTALVIASTGVSGSVKSLLSSPPAVIVGLISYSAYLWHQPLFAYAEIWRGRPLQIDEKLLLIGITLAVAWVSWRFVERPFRDRKRTSRKFVFSAAVSGSFILASLGLTLHLAHGFPSRFSQEANQLAESMKPSPFRNECHTWSSDFRKPADACTYFGDNGRVAVMGDSHAIELAYALAERIESTGLSIVHLSFSGCPPAYRLKTENPGCSEWTREAVDWLDGNEKIENVVLVYRHDFYLFGDQTKTYPALPDKHPPFQLGATAAEAREAYWASLKAQITALRRAGKRVWLVDPFPELPFAVERFVYTRKPRGSVATTRDWQIARANSTRTHLAALAQEPGVSLIDPLPAFCSRETCRWRDGKKVLYFDDNHLSIDGAQRAVDQTFGALLKELGVHLPGSDQ